MTRVLKATALAILLLPTMAHAKPPRPFSSYDAEAKALLARMTLDEKIGQMTQADQHQLADLSDIETYFLGSVLSGAGSDPKTNRLQDWTDLYDSLQERALKTRLRIPILYGVDAVHGHNNVQGATVFPHNIGLGASATPSWSQPARCGRHATGPDLTEGARLGMLSMLHRGTNSCVVRFRVSADGSPCRVEHLAAPPGLMRSDRLG